MPYLMWKDEFSVGVALIDEDHRQLLEITNRLYDALSSGDDPLPLCDALIEHTLVHFTHEEQWFDSMRYPRAAAHRLMHVKLKQRLVGYRAKLGGSMHPAVDDFAQFADWLAHHIRGEDRSYGVWLNSQGVR